MTTHTFSAPKIVGSTATIAVVSVESRTGLSVEMTLLASTGVPHNGAAGRIAMYFGRHGSDQDLVAWVPGVSTGIYSVAAGTALVVPVSATAVADGTYDFAIWWEPTSGVGALLYSGSLVVSAAHGNAYDLSGAGGSASATASTRVYYGAAAAGLNGTTAIEAALFSADVSLTRDFRYPASLVAQKGYVAHPTALGLPPWTLDAMAIGELTARDVILHDLNGVFVPYTLRETSRVLTGTARPFILELSNA